MDRQGAVAALKAAVAAFGSDHASGDERWCIALSGGADSLALTAVAAACKPTTALIVDHQLQSDSGRVAAAARDQALSLGCVDAQILTVTSEQPADPRRPPAALATARWTTPAARPQCYLRIPSTTRPRRCCSGWAVDPAHGRSQVCARAIPPWYRPLLGVRRAHTHAACAELGLTPWQDPHNADRRFTRTRLRNEVLPLLEEVLGGGVAEALARTATALREDTDTLDELALRALAEVGADGGLDTGRLAALPEAVRRRVIRGWLLTGGASGLTDKQIRGVDTLVTAWRGQGGVAVGSPLRNQRLIAGRRDGMLTLHSEPV